MSKNQGRDYSVCQERDIAKYLQGKVQSNSGGTRFGGGDVHTKHFLVEAKTPTKSQSSFLIHKEWLEKAKNQAFEQGKYFWSLAFRFDPEGQDFFIVDKWLMKQLVDCIDGGENSDIML